MANDFSSFDGLVSQLINAGIPLQRPAMPPVNLYCTPLKLDGPVVEGKVLVPVVTEVQAVQVNPTTFENHADTLDNSEATLVVYSAQFGFTNPYQLKGINIGMVFQSHLTELEKKIQSAINAVITATKFTATPVDVSAGSWAVANLETLMAGVPSRSIVALAPDYFVKTKGTWMPSGEESRLREFSDLTGIGENVTGFAARPEAIALVYGYPHAGPAGQVTTSMIKLPIGLDVQFSRWFSRGGRSWSASLDICLSAEVGQAGALKLLRSATPG
jgi:hypothetical protein